MGNIHWGAAIYFEDVELGRDKPFDQVTFRYCIPDDRAGTKIELLLNPQVQQSEKGVQITGGTTIGTFTIQGTGGWGWENMKSFSMPVKIDRPGRHGVTLVFRSGDGKGTNNAVCNLHTITFSDSSADKSR
jgi:hypothetical protein